MTDIEQASKDFVRAAERSTTLYALSAEYLQLVDLLEDEEVDPHLVEQELDRISTEIGHKAEAISGLIVQFEHMAAMRGSEARRMADGATRFNQQAERLRAYLLKHMQATDMKRIETSRFSLNVRQNPPRVEVLEATLVPHEFNRQKIIVEVDKTRIREHWKTTGEVVPGVEIVRTERLDIR